MFDRLIGFIQLGFDRRRPGLDDHLGFCPECGSAGYPFYVNVGKNIFMLCPIHKCGWWAGHGLFSSWEEETEADWARNRALLAEYRKVEPAHLSPWTGWLVRLPERLLARLRRLWPKPVPDSDVPF